jgi:hypothetical protein
MGISVDSIWSQAQRLSASDRLALSRRLRESVNETEVERRERVASEIDRFFGGWSDDSRTTDEMMEHIRAGRMTVVTHNQRHFNRIEDIKTEDWTL